MSDVTSTTPAEQRQLDAILRWVAEVQTVVAALRVAARDLPAADRVRIDSAITRALTFPTTTQPDAGEVAS